MESSDIEIFSGGNMNAPKRIGEQVFRTANPSTETIHKLLSHVRTKGIDWVPVPFGINSSNEEVLSYIPGEVPHSMPAWIWNEDTLVDVARAQREWHDATSDFEFSGQNWQLESNHPIEVICHNDFAPYNIVFANQRFKGLIDFDLCSPGNRLWDIAYTLYRFVPVMPCKRMNAHDEVSPFGVDEMIRRIQLYMKNYSKGDKDYDYPIESIFKQISIRLVRLSEWTADYGQKMNNSALIENSKMYQWHSRWVQELLA